jgi:hypothetical protein
MFASLYVEEFHKLHFSMLVFRTAANLADIFKATDIEIHWITLVRELRNPTIFLQKIPKLEIINNPSHYIQIK